MGFVKSSVDGILRMCCKKSVDNKHEESYAVLLDFWALHDLWVI